MLALKTFNSIFDLIRVFPDEQSCIDHLEALRWDGNVSSPFKADSKVYKCKDNKYKCKSSGKYFNVRTDTIFEGSKIILQHWFMAIYLFTSNKRGISSYQLARDLDITQKSAWFMLQRIRFATEHDSFMRELEGTVEVDETFVGGKNRNRHKDKKVPLSQGRSFKDKTPVFGAIERGGLLRAKVIADTKLETIHPLVVEYVKANSNLMSDEWVAYKNMNRHFNHNFVDHNRKQYVNEDGASTNCMENFWSHFKRTILGTYFGVSRRHLQQYVNESVFRFNTRKETVDGRFNMLLQTTNGKRLLYKSFSA